MNVQIWFVDCQNDFMKEDGALFVQGSHYASEQLYSLREAATAFGVRAVYTQDFHAMNDPELSDKPDFKTTFPPHCIGGTRGADFINEVYNGPSHDCRIISPEDDLVDILMTNDDLDEFLEKDVILTKQIFSTFDGNKNAETYVEATRPDIVFICGVAGDVCVKAVVEGFQDMNETLKSLDDEPIKICVVSDAIASIDQGVTNDLFGNLEAEDNGFVVDVNYVWDFLQMTAKFRGTL